MENQIQLPADEDLSEAVKARLAGLPPLNVFRLLAGSKAHFTPFLDLALSVLAGASFDARKREIAVLRVARATHSNYEWVQHAKLAERIGLSPAEIELIEREDPVTGLDEEGNLLCRVADEISREVRLSDAALAEIIRLYGHEGALELIICCAYFNMLSRVLESSRVPLES